MTNPLIEAEKKKAIMRLWRKSIEIINKEVDLGAFKDEFFPRDERVLWLELAGMEDLNTGYLIREGKLHIIEKLNTKPTVTIWADEDTLLGLIMQPDYNPMVAFLQGDIDVEGDEYLRDLELFEHIFKKYAHLRKKLLGAE